MAQGIITTARGNSLNLDMLIEQAKRPLGMKESKSEIKKTPVPKRRPVNVRGFVPAQGEAEIPEVPEDIKEELAKREAAKVKSSYRRADGGKAQSMADLTGIRLDKPKYLKKEDLEGKKPTEQAEETLNDILGDLNASHSNASTMSYEDEEIESDQNDSKNQKTVKKKT